jgi:hypothetical protein
VLVFAAESRGDEFGAGGVFAGGGLVDVVEREPEPDARGAGVGAEAVEFVHDTPDGVSERAKLADFVVGGLLADVVEGAGEVVELAAGAARIVANGVEEGVEVDGERVGCSELFGGVWHFSLSFVRGCSELFGVVRGCSGF